MSARRGAAPRPDSRRTPEQREAIRELVRTSWNRLSTSYRPVGTNADPCFHYDEGYREWLRPVVAECSRGARVLDLGCGTGVPVARMLAEKFHVTGLDLSDTMIRRARRLVPTATFLREDMTLARFPERSFSAVIALYSMIHVPREELRSLVGRISSWLVQGGLFVSIVGHGAWEGTARGWLGSRSPMFWSHVGGATYRRWLRGADFTIVHWEYVPEGSGGHDLVLARRGRSPNGDDTRRLARRKQGTR